MHNKTNLFYYWVVSTSLFVTSWKLTLESCVFSFLISLVESWLHKLLESCDAWQLPGCCIAKWLSWCLVSGLEAAFTSTMEIFLLPFVSVFRTCEVCGSIAKNVVGSGETEPTEHWNEAATASPPPSSSSETHSFWQGRRFLNLLLACLVFAFVVSWLFHFNVPGWKLTPSFHQTTEFLQWDIEPNL